MTDSFGSIDKDKARDMGIEILPEEAWLDTGSRILSAAALENQITKENVDKISKQVFTHC
jgi:glutamate dehydrogenase (NAD(P)+)